MGKKILFIEDEPELHEELRERLNALGYKVDLAPNTLDAYSVLIYDKNQANYNLAILDLMMDAGFLGKEYPKWQGYGGLCMLEEIHNNNVDIKIIVYTHDESDETNNLVTERGIKLIYKKASTAKVDAVDEIINEINNMMEEKNE
ncbi:Two component system response regulator [Desulfonema limicola]|uniref:Two component system response regulator n=1 Tax=Desulfonema limicola TaxID=45656 RepID=A0A975GEQ1_9BACT|nr:response regulator [Desulfonema limicola]QTA78462.1 Two component system response regulator [Desulfonema limicola]